jgi:hypothetical protein
MILSLSVKLYVVIVFLSRIIGCPAPGVRCYTIWKQPLHKANVSSLIGLFLFIVVLTAKYHQFRTSA